MHFGTTEEQDLLQATLRRFTSEALPPDRRRALFEAGPQLDRSLWREAADIGLAGLMIPEAYGGAGLTLLDQALAGEVLGESACPGPWLAHALVGLALSLGGSEAQRARWLPALASGECIGGVAFGESGDRWEAADWRVAVESGRVTGTKCHAHAGDETGLFLVGLAGGRVGLVEADATGLRRRPIEGHDRSRALCDLELERTPIELLDARPGLGEPLLDAARVLLAADAFGAAWQMIRASVDYANTREQFDTKIAQFQAVKHQLADMAMAAEPMRGLIWYAAWAFDHRPAERAREAVTAKAHVTDGAVRIGRAAVALHGGIGFTWDCDVHLFLKRAMFDRAWLGSPTAHRARLACLAAY